MTLKDELYKRSVEAIEVKARLEEAHEYERLRVQKRNVERWIHLIEQDMYQVAAKGKFEMNVGGIELYDFRVELTKENVQCLLDFCSKKGVTATAYTNTSGEITYISISWGNEEENDDTEG